MKKKITAKKGYTLVEVSVVIALMAIVASLVMVNLQSGRSEQQVKAAQDEVASAVKLAQSFALQGKIQNGSVPSRYGVDGSGGGYRVYYCSPADSGCANKQTVEQHNLSGGVAIAGSPDFRFDVPHGNVMVGGGSQIIVSKGAFSRLVRLEGGGAIAKN